MKIKIKAINSKLSNKEERISNPENRIMETTQSEQQTERQMELGEGGGLVQDGGVEGCALTPSCESTGITTNC